MKNMGDKGSAWILCASKKFPGKFYYFNTKTGENGWTLSDGMNCLNGTQKKNKLKNMDPGEDTPTSNSHANTTQNGSNLTNTTLPSTHLDPNRVDLPDLNIFKTQTRLNIAQNKQYTLKQPKLNNDINESSNSRKLQIIQRFPQGQANLLTNTNLPMNETSFTGNTRMSNELVLNETSVIGNTQMSKGSLFNKPVLWRQSKRLFSDSEDSSSPNLNMEKRREVSFSQQKRLRTESGFPFTSNKLNDWHSKDELPLNTSFSLKHAKPLKHFNNWSSKFSPATSGSFTPQAKYKPALNNPFSSKVKHVKQKNTYYKLGRIIENSKDETQSHSLIFNWDLDDAQMNIGNNNSQLLINNQNLKSDNVKVDIHYLRRLSKSKSITEWWLVPDVEVLLENFDYLKEFVVQDLTCSIMSPAAVLRVVYLMRDDCGAGDGRAAVAEKVFEWLATHSVCEVNEDVYPLKETVIHEQIIKSCVRAKIQHLVLITKNKQLMHAAKLNGIHAYYLSELKIQHKTVENNNNDTKDNLFQQNMDGFDPFPLSKKQECIVENNNNAAINNMNFTIPKPSPFEETKPYYEHIEIRLSNNGERIVVHNENLNKRKKFDDEFLRSIQVTVNRNEKSTMDIDQESDEIFPIIKPNANKQIYFDQRETKKTFMFNNNSFFKACENSKSKPKTQRKANMFVVNNPIAGVSSNESSGIDKILPITHDNSEIIEKKINDFCAKHADLQAIVNDRLEEFTCWYLQIMEGFMDEFFQQDDVKNFEPPYWFLQGVRCLREYYCRDKAICALADKLIGISGYCIKNGVIRINIKADQFLKILGAGMILIEMVENSSRFPECGMYKDMLNNMVAGMRHPEDFPESESVSLPLRSSLDDGAFSMVNADITESSEQSEMQ